MKDPPWVPCGRRQSPVGSELNRNVLRLAVVFLGLLFAGAPSAADRGKVLHVASTNIETLDPQRWNDDPSYQIQFAIFEGLYEWDYLASPSRLVPNTATAMPTIADDGRTWTIRVKPGIHFTDDRAFNGKRRELVAEDYVYSLKRVLDPGLQRGGSPVATDLIVGARAVVDAASKQAAGSTTTGRWKGCARLTATRCNSSSPAPTTR